MHLNNQSSNAKYLILGGARSGKSSHAETLAKDFEKEVIYIATAEAHDIEIEARIARHKQDRPSDWKTIEEPTQLTETLTHWSTPDNILLIDCLTMWITNLLSNRDSTLLEAEVEKLLRSIKKLPGIVIFVSNEVSMGIIPMGELTRKYVDESGRLHQKLAQQVDNVTLMVAGLPLTIKPQN